MKRKAPIPRSGCTTENIEQDLSPAQLCGIGKVAIAWNDVEYLIDNALYSGMRLPSIFWTEITNQMAKNAKIKLIAAAAESMNFSDKIKKVIDNTTKEINQLSIFRNAVIHARVYDNTNGIGQLITRGGIEQILLTEEALDGLYKRLVLIRHELRCILALFDLSRTFLIMFPANQLNTLISGNDFQQWMNILQDYQKQRAALTPFAPFPT